MEERLKYEWYGDEVKSNSMHSDYERACAVKDFTGLIEVGDGLAIVLGDEPLQTTVYMINGSPVIIRWIWAEDDTTVENYVANLAIDQLSIETVILNFRNFESNLILFDSCIPGNEAADILDFSLQPGEYSISTAFYEPDNETRCLVHFFRQM